MNKKKKLAPEDVYHADEAYRNGQRAGYEKAKKELGLTWEDVQWIDDTIIDLAQTDLPRQGKEAFYSEVLKRFNEKKNGTSRN